MNQAPEPSIERTSQRPLRDLCAATTHPIDAESWISVEVGGVKADERANDLQLARFHLAVPAAEAEGTYEGLRVFTEGSAKAMYFYEWSD